MEIQNFLLTGMTLSIAGALVFLVLSSRSHSAKSKNNQLPEGKHRGLYGQLIITKLDKALALQIAEQFPVIMKKMTERLPVDSYPPIIVRYVKKISMASQVGYFVPLKDTEYYTLQVGCGFPEDWQGKICFSQGDGALGQALRKRIIITRQDVERRGICNSQLSLEGKGIEPDYVAPVYGISGIEGVLVVASCPTPSMVLKVQISMLVDLLSLAIQNATLLNSTERGEYYDYLTGLANRLYFTRIFETEIRKAWNYLQPTSLLFFDIDQFKNINDTWGHQVGDQVLRKVAQVAKSCTRSEHHIARYGGDEFVVVLPSTNKDQAFHYAENLREKISNIDFPIEGQIDPVNIKISIGISMFPADGRSTSDLVRAADEALYDAKNSGKNRIAVYHSINSNFDPVVIEEITEEESNVSLKEKIGST